MRLINRKEIRKEHFNYFKYDKENIDHEVDAHLPVMLTQDGMRKFLLNFTNMLRQKYYYEGREGKFELSRIFLMQAQKIARTFQGREQYCGFNWKFGQPL